MRIVSEDEFIEMSTNNIFFEICKRHLQGENINKLAKIFHNSIANFIVITCKKIRNESKISTAALTGGVFQNTLLLKLTSDKLKKSGFDVLRHKLVPANDGGICLGQAVYAAHKL